MKPYLAGLANENDLKRLSRRYARRDSPALGKPTLDSTIIASIFRDRPSCASDIGAATAK